MEKLLKSEGKLNRRAFLQACGLAVVVTATYGALPLVFGEAKAHAENVNINVPEEMMDASLPNPPLFGDKGQGKSVTKGWREKEERIKEIIENKLGTVRPGHAVGGVRG